MEMLCASVLAMPGTAACSRVSGFISDSLSNVVESNGEQVSYAYDVALRHMHFAVGGPNRTSRAEDGFEGTTQPGVVVALSTGQAYDGGDHASSRCSASGVHHGLSWIKLGIETQNQPPSAPLCRCTTCCYDHEQHDYDSGYMRDGPNLYAYVNQNPWTHFDPNGLFKVGSSIGGGLYTTPAVHETITWHSFVVSARLSPRAAPVAGGDSYSNFVDALQEGSRKPDTQGYSTESIGIPMGFITSFKAAEYGIKGDMRDNHFGNKQWNHSMSSGDPAIKDAAALSNQIQSGLSAKFESAITASAKGDWQTAGGLLGEICHTVQDSYSQSHCARDADGRIASFNNYAMQDGNKHGTADTSSLVRKGQERNLDAMKKNIPGVTEACKATEGVFDAFFNADNPREAFKNHMANVFETTPKAKINTSGGKKYEKD